MLAIDRDLNILRPDLIFHDPVTVKMARRGLISGALALALLGVLPTARAEVPGPSGYSLKGNDIRMAMARRLGFEGLYIEDNSHTTWTQAVNLRCRDGANRVIIAIAATNGSNGTATSCTVLGTALTQDFTSGTGTQIISIYHGVQNGGGQAGNMVSVNSANTGRWAIALFAKDTFASTTPTVYSDTNGTGRDAALSLSPGSYAYLGQCGTTTDHTRWNWADVLNSSSPQHGALEIGRTHVGTNNNLSFGGWYSRRLTETRNVHIQNDNGASNTILVGLVFT